MHKMIMLNQSNSVKNPVVTVDQVLVTIKDHLIGNSRKKYIYCYFYYNLYIFIKLKFVEKDQLIITVDFTISQ
jgi:hypothetical protein